MLTVQVSRIIQPYTECFVCFQVTQNGSLSDFFENFGGQLEEVNFVDGFATEVAVPSPVMSTATIGQPAAVPQPDTGIGYQNLPATSHSNRIVALNVPVAQSSALPAVSQHMVYYNGLR